MKTGDPYRIGLLLPPANVTMEPELWAMAPEGVVLHVSRLSRSTFEVTVDSLTEMRASCGYASRLLAMAGPNVIVYGCTSGSLIGGPAWDRAIIDEVEGATGIPTVTTAGAVAESLLHLGVRKVAVVAPYVEEVTEREGRYLEQRGFSVSFLKGMGLRDTRDIARVRSWELLPLLEEAAAQGPDGIFISCTNLPSVGLIAITERRFGIPVVSSNSASLWAALRRGGWEGKSREGYGRLLEEVGS